MTARPRGPQPIDADQGQQKFWFLSPQLYYHYYYEFVVLVMVDIILVVIMLILLAITIVTSFIPNCVSLLAVLLHGSKAPGTALQHLVMSSSTPRSLLQSRPGI